ncbi:MAG: exodeoxyribonuclease VII large subunit [Ignavibacteria bacterium]|jgi:exodeoxyribonuclease VII large subunit
MEDIKNNVLSVSELTKEIKLALEENFSRISVIGEISNFKSHVSGHWYFNLKDSDAVINCTMWKGFNNYVYFTPQDGMKVIVNGSITVYPPRGSYQIDVRSIQPAGLGELQEAFEKLKQKLMSEGLFEAAAKKSLPSFPERIGLVTAIGSAALQDMISVADRRFPAVELVIAPATVQGAGAAESIVNAIKQLNLKKNIDVIILGRGGGSIEDLWAFNEEKVARAIYSSSIPVVSAIGHEVDFTIADFVADLRAPTPSVAMEVATPDIDEIFVFLNDFSYNASNHMKKVIDEMMIEIGPFTNSYAVRYPMDLLRKYQQKIDLLAENLLQKIDQRILAGKNKVSFHSKSVSLMDVDKTLKRGFVLVKQDSEYITTVKKFNRKKRADLLFHDGDIKVKA